MANVCYVGNRFAVTAGTVSGTVQPFVFIAPTMNTPVSANAMLFPSFLISVSATGATLTNTVTLTLPDGYAMPLVLASTMANATVTALVAGTVAEIAPKMVSGVLTGVIVGQ